MGRYRLKIEYDGAPFSGWQRQLDAPSVQGQIERALEKIGEPGVIAQGAGRTDAGVHAKGQVAHADLTRPWRPFRLMEALNAHLRNDGHPIAILACDEVSDDFHARFSAIERTYLYRIVQRRAPLTVDHGLAWNVKQELDVEKMNEAAKLLLGEHDFTTFRSTECQAKSPVKTLDTLEVVEQADADQNIIEISTTARSYLHNQVRSLVGCLKLVGDGKWDRQDLRRALEARDRSACAPVAPAHGLYLMSVRYD